MPPPSKKVCMVCGDKALGYNFNAVTCESCKAFFRRNALLNKEFTCPFSSNCEITVITRRFCQRCRLEKCFQIGMKKEHIMSEEDKIIKKKKIEQNRAKRKLDPGSKLDECNKPTQKIKREDVSSYDGWSEKEEDFVGQGYSRSSPCDFNNSSASCESLQQETYGNVSTVSGTGSSVVDNPVLPTAISSASEIVESIASNPDNSTRIINHLMKTPKEAVEIMAKVINAPADAMRLISHLINYPGDALKIISKIMNSPFDALTVFTKFMSSPTDALEIITKVVSSPSDVLQFMQQLMSCPEDAVQIMNKFMSSPAEALRMINRMVNQSTVDSTTETCEPNANYGDSGASNSMINLMLNSVQSPNSSIAQSPETTLPHTLSSSSSSPPSTTISTCVKNEFNGNDAFINSNRQNNFVDNLMSSTSTSDILFNTNNSQPQPPPPPPLDAMRNIFEDVEDRPIQPNSIESVLCEAIKLEYEMYNSLPQPSGESRELNDAEQSKLTELIVANKALYYPVDDDLLSLINDDERIKCDGNQQDPQLLKVINLTAVAIRRLIKMSKKINAFRNMCQEDQVALLKGGCTEMMIMRSVMSYDCDHATWKIPHSKEAMSNIKVDVLKLAKGNVYEEHDRFIRTFEPKWRMDENIILIMCAIVLFTPTRPRVIHSDVIKLEQNSYYYLLRRYLESVYPGCEAKSTFIKLIQKISEVQRLNEVIIGVYLNVNPTQVEPLLREIFDLKNH